jgi:hypothetical protein
VYLHVAPDPEHVGLRSDERSVDVEPVALELLSAERGQAPQREHELDHPTILAAA